MLQTLTAYSIGMSTLYKKLALLEPVNLVVSLTTHEIDSLPFVRRDGNFLQ